MPPAKPKALKLQRPFSDDHRRLAATAPGVASCVCESFWCVSTSALLQLRWLSILPPRAARMCRDVVGSSSDPIGAVFSVSSVMSLLNGSRDRGENQPVRMTDATGRTYVMKFGCPTSLQGNRRCTCHIRCRNSHWRGGGGTIDD